MNAIYTFSNGNTLFIASRDAITESVVARNQIQYILCLGRENQMTQSEIDEFALNGYQCFDVEDDDHHYARMQTVLCDTRSALSDWLTKGSVVVHCRQGVSRSATVVIDFLSRVLDITTAEALKLVQQKRPGVFLHEVFQKLLKI